MEERYLTIRYVVFMLGLVLMCAITNGVSLYCW